jgi:hypothetical protein
MRVALLLVGLAACSLEHGVRGGGSGSGTDGGGSVSDAGSGSAGSDGGIDAPACAWSYTPTNFDPCSLPAPASFTVTSDTTLDTGTTNLPKKVITQSDGSTITVIHLSSFTVNGFVRLTVNGTGGVVFAVDGGATINGVITVTAGNDNATHCTNARGKAGTDSQNTSSGGGGGGGASAQENGGNGGNGDGSQAGVAGVAGTTIGSSMLSPLRAGCRGGSGGRLNSTGASAAGGPGGGALQISTNAKITLTGIVDAAGRGGVGAPTARTGGGGGGSGGAILLEGPEVQLNLASRVCADGGAGGEGGGASVDGNTGNAGACSGIGGAQSPNTSGSVGGDGGDGGYLLARSGGNGQSSGSSGGGGGGGGGAVGWIRIVSPNLDNNGSVITPSPTN